MEVATHFYENQYRDNRVSDDFPDDWRGAIVNEEKVDLVRKDEVQNVLSKLKLCRAPGQTVLVMTYLKPWVRN